MITKRITGAALFVLCAFSFGGRNQAAQAPLTNIAGPAYGTRVMADTQYSEKHSGANAVDGRLEPGEACWYSRDWTKLPCALTFELAGEEDVRQVVLHQARWGGNMYHTKELALETSADGRAWTRVAAGELADDNLAKLALDVNVRTRWLRAVVLTSYNPFQTCGFTEVEILAAGHLGFGAPEIRLNGRAAPATMSVCALSFVAAASGPQAAVYARPSGILASVRQGEEVALDIPLFSVPEPLTLCAEVALKSGQTAQVEVTAGEAGVRRTLAGAKAVALEVPVGRPADGTPLSLRTRVAAGEAAVQWSNLRLVSGGKTLRVPLLVREPEIGRGAPPIAPSLRPPLQRALLEWDWKMQDGIGTERNPSSYPDATAQVLERGQRLIDDLCRHGHRARLGDRLARWAALKRERDGLAKRPADDPAWEGLYLRLHRLRREISLQNPLFPKVPILFAKQVPGAFSHQLTQVYGRYARPGGGIFVLDKPGASMAARQLAPKALPMGSYSYPEVSFAGDRVLFAYCLVDTAPQDTVQGHHGRYYHLYEMKVDGTGLKRITSGPYNDFSPRYRPDGRILMVSTRRGGWHRCGSPGCENYTLAVMNRDGSKARPISFHETQEWDPAVLHDGRIIYTRWDYVDRHPVYYEHLWTTFPDGTRPSVFFGNNTFNPVGIWEAQPVPGSNRVMATTGAHHAMTAGSIVLVDVGNGVDGLQCLTRLTPDAPFPESETAVGGSWFAPKPDVKPFETAESKRWPGHCYRTPYPFSETYFLAAYSFQGLIGEPRGNAANMWGLYWVDAFGNKELLYRDPNIASLWPVPVQARKRPPVVPSHLDPSLGKEGVFVVQDVYASDPPIPRGTVKALRIVQVLPKSTPAIDNPPVGRPRGAPGKQVLGTVPVEPDGSASFRVPAGIEVAFQALDARGMAVQVMRSGTYLQPGERATCVGCHETRTSVPQRTKLMATARPPSRIQPGPDGSRPFSYPVLVQPVLDKHCVSCHDGDKPAGGVALAGRPEGHYTASYNALSARVPYSDLDNGDAVSRPGRFGAHGSPVMKKLLDGHGNVKLSDAELRRLATWMDVALFYGTFDPADQARQKRGERIKGPALQ